MTTLNILIVDDHKVVREGLKFILECQEGFDSRIDEAETVEKAIMMADSKNYDVILMDIRIGNGSGIEATKAILKEDPDTNILALSMFSEEHKINEMVKAGAKGYILKDCGSEELAQAILTVAEGHNYFSNEVALTLMGFNKTSAPKYRSPITQNENSITKREMEVLHLIANELTNDEIAQELNLSKRTVDSHRQKMLVKLGLRNTAGLVRYAIENNLINSH